MDSIIINFQYATEGAKFNENNSAYSFSELDHALSGMGYSNEGKQKIFKLVAAILHLGNISFQEKVDKSGTCQITDDSKCYLQNAADLIEITTDTLEKALISRNLNKET